ncbi:sensor histidine kinase [Salinispirillum marinum]|uniref:Sensor histidine kinase n=2 Tax=Saccharospirillaceae TaxID=255527 RepID=A0ABV8BEX4_9GAMM
MAVQVPENQALPPRSLNLCSDQAAWFVLLISQLLAFVQALLMGPEAFWWHLASASLYCHWVGLLGLLALCHWQRRGVDGQKTWHWVVYWLSLCVIALLGLVMGYAGLRWLLPASMAFSGLQLSMQAAALMMFCALLLRYAYVQQALALRQRAITQAQFDALQARVQPHFLFNAMNAIAALIPLDPKRAEQGIEQLSDLLRASLQTQQPLATLREEVQLAEAYIGLEQARFGTRLQVHWGIDPSLLEQRLPRLTLQLLIENAVIHGISTRPQGGCVAINTERQNRHWQLTVQNPLPESAAVGRGNGIALSTLRQRGKALMGEAFYLGLNMQVDQATATVLLPYQTTEDKEAG